MYYWGLVDTIAGFCDDMKGGFVEVLKGFRRGIVALFVRVL